MQGVPRGDRTAPIPRHRRREETGRCRALQPGEEEVGEGAADPKEREKEGKDEQKSGCRRLMMTLMGRSRSALSAGTIAARIAPSRTL